MSQIPFSDSGTRQVNGYESVAPELTLAETLRVLEVARGMQQDRAEAEVALARNEIREVMRKRLMDAAAITGDKITEADVDAAIDHYFSTQHSYRDPAMSLAAFLAHLYVRRVSIAIMLSLMVLVVVIWKYLL